MQFQVYLARETKFLAFNFSSIVSQEILSIGSDSNKQQRNLTLLPLLKI